jgi:hypothetical protein
MLAGDILNMSSPEGQNSSYVLEYRIPQISCDRTVNTTTMVYPNTSLNVFNSAWNASSDAGFIITQLQEIGRVYKGTGQQSGEQGDVFVEPGDFWESTSFVVEKTELLCRPTSAELHLNKSYRSGVQQLEYVKSDIQPLRIQTKMEFSSNGDTPEFREWTSALKREFELWNTYAVLDAALLGVVYTWNVSSVWTEGGSNVEVTLSNGTKLGDKNTTWVISSAMNLDTVHNCK